MQVYHVFIWFRRYFNKHGCSPIIDICILVTLMLIKLTFGDKQESNWLCNGSDDAGLLVATGLVLVILQRL